MSIQFGKGPQKSQSSSVKMDDGVFVDKGTIVGAKILYNAKKYESWNPNDVALHLALDIEGLQFKKELWIAGDWRKEGTPQGGQVVVGPGGAFKVLRVFDELGIIGEVSDSGTFEGADNLVAALVGRELFFLSYAAYVKDDGSAGYRDYDIVAAQWESETEEETRQRLYGQWKNDDYVQQKYRPELTQAGGGDGASGTDFTLGSDSSDTLTKIQNTFDTDNLFDNKPPF